MIMDKKHGLPTFVANGLIYSMLRSNKCVFSPCFVSELSVPRWVPTCAAFCALNPNELRHEGEETN